MVEQLIIPPPVRELHSTRPARARLNGLRGDTSGWLLGDLSRFFLLCLVSSGRDIVVYVCVRTTRRCIVGDNRLVPTQFYGRLGKPQSIQARALSS